MNKQFRNLLILVGVLVALVAVWLGVTYWPGLGKSDETSAATSQAQTALLTVDLDQVARIAVHNNFSDLTLLPDRTTDANGQAVVSWHLAENQGFPVSQTSLKNLADAALSVTYTDVIVDNPDDLAAFGLNRPVSTVSLVFADGSSRTIDFGGDLSSGNGTYARVSQDSHIYAVDKRFKDLTSQSLKDLIDLSLFVGGFQAPDITGFQFQRRDDQLALASTVTLANPEDAAAGLAFAVTEPVVRDGNADTLTSLLNSVLNLSAVRIVDLDTQDLARYGLQNPKYQFTLTQEGRDAVVVSIGDSAGNGQYFVTSTALPAIMTVQASALTALDLPLEDYVDRFVALMSIWKVSAVSLDLEEAHYDLTLAIEENQKVTDDTVELLLDGKNAKITSQTGTNLFSECYQRLIGIQLAGFDGTAQPESAVTNRITYTLKPDPAASQTEQTMVIEFAPRDAYTDYVLIDGAYQGFYVSHRAVFTSQQAGEEGLQVELKHLQYAIEHAVDGVFDTSGGYPSDT